VTTLLSRSLAREVIIAGAPFKVVVSPSGVGISEKGRRKRVEIPWDTLLTLGQRPRANTERSTDTPAPSAAIVADIAKDVKVANAALKKAVETLERGGDMPAALLSGIEPDPVHGRIEERDDWFIEPLLTSDEVASILRVSRAVAGHLAIRSLRINGELRFRQSAVRAYLRDQEQQASGRW
jgi:hypothetical protein